ncbi:MAG: SDR family NAD(P)-dependent oxidoreductase [Gammaproteobacteria bacterium]
MQRGQRIVAVVTGAARGGGRGIALALAPVVTDMLLVARSTLDHPNRLLPGSLEQVQRAVADAGVNAHWLRADLSRPDQVRTIVDTVAERFGRCDILVNNAAYNPIGAFADLGMGRWQAAMAVNVDAAAALSHAFLPGMITRRRGRIVNIGSLAAVAEVGVSQLPYAVSKAALERLTTALAAELADTGVAVNCIRVDEALRSEALVAMIGDAASSAGFYSPEAFGAAVRWLVQQPDDFTGRLLTFADLRRLGGIGEPSRLPADAAPAL